MKIKAIQGLRGWAVALVMVYHLNLLPGIAGFLGVDLFFVISGFVISRLVKKSLSEGSFTFKNFFLRRFRRLFPPLVAMISISYVSLLFVVSPEGFSDSFVTAIAALFGLSNIAIHVLTGDYFANASDANVFLHTWSLGVEEQVYLLIPIVFFLARRYSVGRLRVSIVFMVASIASLSMFILGSFFEGVHILGGLFSFYSPLVRFWEFGVGILAWLTVEKSVGHSKSWSNARLLAGGLTLIAPLLPLAMPNISREVLTLVMVMASGVLVAALGRQASPSLGILSRRELVFLGDRSYSLYLWHWPIIVTFGFLTNWSPTPLEVLLVLFLTFLTSELSFRLIERRIAATDVGTTLAFASPWIGIGVVLPAVIIALTPNLNGDFWDQSTQRSALTDLATQGCESGSWCLNGVPVTNPPPRLSDAAIYLIGDSSAAMFHEGLLIAAKQVTIDVLASTYSSCPGFKDENFRLTPGCLDYIEVVSNYMESATPGLVVIGVTDRYLLDNPRSAAQVASSMANNLLEFGRRLQHSGHQVIIIETVPNLDWSPEGFSPELWPRDLRENLALSVEGELKTNPWRLEVPALARHFPIFETRDFLCPQNFCTVIRDGKYLYADSNHITQERSREFAPMWEEVLVNWSVDALESRKQ